MDMDKIDDTWLRTWATNCGIMLIAAFLIPIVSPGGTVWFWTMIKYNWLGTLTPLAVGIAALVLKDRLEGKQLALALLIMSVLVLILGMSGGSSMNASHRMPMAAGGMNFGILLMLLATCSIAIGNHLSKTHTQDQYPRLMVGIGGIVVAVLFILPVGGTSPIMGFFSGAAWRFMWPLLLIFAGVLAYGIVAIMQFFKVRGDQTELLSLIARGLLVGIPAVGILYILFGPVPFFTGLTFILKMILTVYGALLLLVTSLTAVIEYNVGSGPGEADSGENA